MSTEARAVPGWRRLLSPGSVLPYLAPWWILVPVIGVLLHNARVDSLQAPLRAAEAERVRADADLLRRSLDRLRNDIRLLSTSPAASSSPRRRPVAAAKRW